MWLLRGGRNLENVRMVKVKGEERQYFLVFVIEKEQGVSGLGISAKYSILHLILSNYLGRKKLSVFNFSLKK